MRVCGDVVCVCIDSSQRVNVDVTCDAGKRGSLKDSVLACGHVCDGSKARIITVLPCGLPTAADSLASVALCCGAPAGRNATERQRDQDVVGYVFRFKYIWTGGAAPRERPPSKGAKLVKWTLGYMNMTSVGWIPY